ncbi:MAG: FAD-dependent oxidoreductase [Candidatus Tectomicrobia bacterium]|uniref:FAD-dependent oxidoreductase n=1 Tax=Tectimicrobiota bacterium TaxID=2528274 RepID=A0A933GN79_UNCTE|nr:FAD-dependent oxidoreductase [Candidatus Tectomicrobia bacterium]
MVKLTRLFESISIGSMELPNRIVMAPMGLNYTNDGSVTDQLKSFYMERAKGGAGLIVVGGSYIDPLGKHMPGMTGVENDSRIVKLKELSQAVQQHGVKIALQILHAGAHAPSSMIGTQPVSASAVKSNLTGEISRELTVDEIKEIIPKYAQAVNRLKQAGFDAVEFNFCTGYLARQFFSPLTNKRTDAYGGKVENRMRFMLEIMETTKNLVSSAYPLICRISANEFMPGGFNLEDAKVLARGLEEAGAQALHITVGGHETSIPLTPGIVPQGAFTYYASEIKKIVNIPVIAATRINNPILAEELLRDNKTDMVSMGRALIADPYLPKKAKEGRLLEIRSCVACHQGCYDKLFVNAPVTCMVNPLTGRESVLEVRPTEKTKKILVIGGGPAGMEAAVVAAERGHNVVLYEESDDLGGQLRSASIPVGKGEFGGIITHLRYQLNKLGVRQELGKKVTPEVVNREQPDVVIAATGSKPASLNIPGVDKPFVMTAQQALQGDKTIGNSVVIIGGGSVGCETAIYLASKGALESKTSQFLADYGAIDPQNALSLTKKGRTVTVLEETDKFGKGIGITTRWIIRKNLKDFGVIILTGVKVKEITDNGVVYTKDSQELTIKADAVVVAIGAKADNTIFAQIKEQGLSVRELYVIGDAKEPRKAIDAIQEAFELAVKI